MHSRTARTNRFLSAVLISMSAGIAAPATGQVINEDFKLMASDGETADMFGCSIAIDNGVIAVGAFRGGSCFDDGLGAAYLFDASTGVQIAKLEPDDCPSGNSFGSSVDIRDGIVAVGMARYLDEGGQTGAAYLFDASTGAQIGKLLANDRANGDEFGESIAIGGGLVAVGAYRDDVTGADSGSAYVFDASTGVQIAKLIPSKSSDRFGLSIAIDDGIVVVGVPLDHNNGFAQVGSAYVFEAATGNQIAILGRGVLDLTNQGDMFGESVAIENGVVAVGVPGDSNSTISRFGSVFLFDAATGDQITAFVSDILADDGRFGTAVAIDNGVVAVSAPFDDENGINSGSAYLFDVSTGDQIVKLIRSVDMPNRPLGSSIAVDSGTVAVGAGVDDGISILSGAAYVFEAPAADCPADLAPPIGVLDFSDVIAFLTAFVAMGSDADLAEPLGVFDFSDVVAFGAGCP